MDTYMLCVRKCCPTANAHRRVRGLLLQASLVVCCLNNVSQHHRKVQILLTLCTPLCKPPFCCCCGCWRLKKKPGRIGQGNRGQESYAKLFLPIYPPKQILCRTDSRPRRRTCPAGWLRGFRLCGCAVGRNAASWNRPLFSTAPSKASPSLIMAIHATSMPNRWPLAAVHHGRILEVFLP